MILNVLQHTFYWLWDCLNVILILISGNVGYFCIVTVVIHTACHWFGFQLMWALLMNWGVSQPWETSCFIVCWYGTEFKNSASFHQPPSHYLQLDTSPQCDSFCRFRKIVLLTSKTNECTSQIAIFVRKFGGAHTIFVQRGCSSSSLNLRLIFILSEVVRTPTNDVVHQLLRKSVSLAARFTTIITPDSYNLPVSHLVADR